MNTEWWIIVGAGCLFVVSVIVSRVIARTHRKRYQFIVDEFGHDGSYNYPDHIEHPTPNYVAPIIAGPIPSRRVAVINEQPENNRRSVIQSK